MVFWLFQDANWRSSGSEGSAMKSHQTAALIITTLKGMRSQGNADLFYETKNWEFLLNRRVCTFRKKILQTTVLFNRTLPFNDYRQTLKAPSIKHKGAFSSCVLLGSRFNYGERFYQHSFEACMMMESFLKSSDGYCIKKEIDF